jgi:anion-transporting  ArsA/GET3 family ATPase
MLDQKQAWDAFVTRHAPSPAVAQRLFGNPFYQRLSSSFAGSTEYMAIEEMCRHADSGQFDTIILDTPPSAHALDFVQAPDRIDRLLDPSLAQLFARGAWRSAGLAARFLFHRLESAASARTLADIAAFFAALSAFVDAALERTHRTRALLRGGEAAFVLVAAPRQLVLDETQALVDRLAAQPTPLAAVVVNRVHTVPSVTPDFTALGDSPGATWLRHAWADAGAEAADEATVIAQCQQLMPRVPFVRVAEGDHDLHSLVDVRGVSAQLTT